MNKFSVQSIRITIFLLLAVSITLSGLFVPKEVFAVPNTVPSGITISPITQTLELPHTQPQIGTDITATNNTPGAITLTARVVDFNSLDETGGVLFAGSNESALTAKFGLFRWTNLDKNTLTLAAGQTQKVHLLVNNSDQLSPGGHYGAVLFQLNGTVAQGASKVSLNQVVSSLVFVSKLGGELYNLRLDRPKGGVFWATLPGKVSLRFYAGGNEYMIPRGTVTAYDPFGKVAAHGVINESSNIILPQTHRRYAIGLSRSARSLLPGHYTVKVRYRYEGRDTFTVLTYGFWVVNVEGVAILLVGVAFLVLVYRRRHSITRRLERFREKPLRFLKR